MYFAYGEPELGYPRKKLAAKLNFHFCKDIFSVLCYADSVKQKVK